MSQSSDLVYNLGKSPVGKTIFKFSCFFLLYQYSNSQFFYSASAILRKIIYEKTSMDPEYLVSDIFDEVSKKRFQWNG